MQLTPLQLDLISQHALKSYPSVMCGVLTAGSFIPMANLSIDPARSFSFDPVEYAKVINKTLAIVHSHCKPVARIDIVDLRTPSLADMQGQRRTAKPWLIVGCEGMTVSEPLCLPRVPSNEYTGRTFIWYINDCYTLIQDYYQFELGIELPGHDPAFDWSDQAQVAHAFDPYIADYGFTDIETINDMRNGDLLLLNSHGLQHNHLGVYHNGDVLHQDGISRAVPFTSYIGRINRILRYAH